MEIDPVNTALVISDPQNDFLSPDGVTWGVVGESMTENHTVENIERMLKAFELPPPEAVDSRGIALMKGPAT